MSELADLVAERVVSLLDARSRSAPAYVDAAELAAILSVSRGFVYDHQDELGGERLTDGPKPRIRFDVERARAAMAARSVGGRAPAVEVPARPQVSVRRRRPRAGTGVELLPIRGQGSGS